MAQRDAKVAYAALVRSLDDSQVEPGTPTTGQAPTNGFDNGFSNGPKGDNGQTMAAQAQAQATATANAKVAGHSPNAVSLGNTGRSGISEGSVSGAAAAGADDAAGGVHPGLAEATSMGP